MKKLFTFLLALAASVGTLFAASGKCGDNLTWNLTDGVLTISGTGSMTNYDIPWYSFRSSIKNVAISYGVTSIGSYAFEGCDNLTSVTIPESVTSIGNSAFYGCKSLIAVHISDLAAWCKIKFGDNPLYYAHNLYVHDLYHDGTLITDLVIPDGITSISGAFDGCSSLTSVTIPESVTSIGNSAFSGCSSLTSVTIPNSVTSIGERAFYWCTGLTSVTIPNSVTSIGDMAFSGCSGLTSVTIPNSVTSIGGWAFNSCTGLTAVHISDLAAWCKIKFDDFFANPLYYAHNLYVNGELASDLVIPNSVTSIGKCVFSGCESLTSVTIPNSVTSIGSYAFADCSGLTSVTIPESVTSIGNSAFDGCSGLTSVTIPNSVTWIGENAFYKVHNIIYDGTAKGSPWGAKSVNGYMDGYFVYSDESKTNLLGCLTSIEGNVTIPNSVTNIGDRAFENCIGLISVTLPNSVIIIGNYAFSGCSSLTSVTIGNGVTSIGEYAFHNCVGLTSVTIPNGVTSIGGWAFSGCSSLTSVTIPNSVTSIGESAFNGCSSLTSVTIPNSVTSIGGSAFENCSGLTSVTIPNSVTSIGSHAFSYCSSLTSVTIPNSVTSIGSYAFNKVQNIVYNGIATGSPWEAKSVNGYVDGYFVYNNESKTKLLGCSSAIEGKVTIPNSVTSIGDWAFYSCTGLTSVTIPKSIKSIGEYAFYDCSNLNSITIEANTPPSLGDYAFDSTNDCPINVPYNTVNTYKNAWTEYSSRIKGNSESFTITFLDWDGTVLQSSQVEEGTLPEYTGATPERAEDEKYTYTFSGWSPAIVAATSDATYTARYEATKKVNTSFTITFLDWDGTVLQSSQVEEGTLPKYTGTTPVRPDDEQYTYTFNGWSPAIVAATADATYTARYEATKKETNTCGDNLTWDLTDGVLTISGTGKMEDYKSSSKVPWYSYSSSITSVIIKEGVTSIGEYAFSGCSSLASVTIPNSVTSIGHDAFSGCSGLTSITIPNSVTYIGFAVFIGCGNLKSIDTDADNPNYSSVDGVLFNKDKTTLIQCPGGKQGAYTIPNSVTSIGDNAFYFYNCTGLTSITIPNSVTSIGGGAFAYSSGLTSIDIPNSVTSIGESTFYGCNNLTSVTIPNSVTSIGLGAFCFCSRLESVVIGNGVKEIREFTFMYCPLKSITIGTGIREISSDAFMNVEIDGFNEYGQPMPKTDAAGNFIYTVEKVVCYAKVPPTIDVPTGFSLESFIDNFANATIYVLAESVAGYRAYNEAWGRLDIRPINAESVATDNLVITPSETSADIIWPAVSGAATYELVIKKDKNGNVVCTLVFNANGQLASIAFYAPARGDAPQQTQGSGFSFTVTGLDSGSSYDLTMASKDEKGNTIDEKHLSFSTTGNSPEAINTVEASMLGSSTKILRNGQIFILRGEKEYTLTGQEVR